MPYVSILVFLYMVRSQDDFDDIRPWLVCVRENSGKLAHMLEM